ncbi:hypothetical protein [Oceanirhabdus sp. W0125-5]|uniref:hypothetical protein n=1 Tax=Oceanirhabdus sp. W0125-5 TaxID=2999116 RepID=UPI0022F2B671|nr:hypothetical protein [Oceanirhabdus sp. W0125-5]WBW95568.1 hypothetical protein OW730_17980 [Oceanirhabdus sp. W0125-5]
MPQILCPSTAIGISILPVPQKHSKILSCPLLSISLLINSISSVVVSNISYNSATTS